MSSNTQTNTSCNLQTLTIVAKLLRDLHEVWTAYNPNSDHLHRKQKSDNACESIGRHMLSESRNLNTVSSLVMWRRTSSNQVGASMKVRKKLSNLQFFMFPMKYTFIKNGFYRLTFVDSPPLISAWIPASPAQLSVGCWEQPTLATRYWIACVVQTSFGIIAATRRCDLSEI